MGWYGEEGPGLGVNSQGPTEPFKTVTTLAGSDHYDFSVITTKILTSK